jgi:prepilin-type N-terminal cleavage/methylation domain-containing protein
VKHRVPSQKKGLAGRGFTLVEVMIVILIISVITAIAVPNFMQTRARSRRTVCLENLRLIESAKTQAAMAKNLKEGSTMNWSDLLPTYIKKMPQCPTGGAYTVGNVGTDATCSLATIGHHD